MPLRFIGSKVMPGQIGKLNMIWQLSFDDLVAADLQTLNVPGMPRTPAYYYQIQPSAQQGTFTFGDAKQLFLNVIRGLDTNLFAGRLILYSNATGQLYMHPSSNLTYTVQDASNANAQYTTDVAFNTIIPFTLPDNSTIDMWLEQDRQPTTGTYQPTDIILIQVMLTNYDIVRQAAII